MKYIPADKLIAYINRKIESIENCPFQLASFGEEKKSEGELIAYKDALSIITSLQQERTEVGLEVSKFCQPVPENIANCVAEHYWEMLDDEKKEDTRAAEPAQQEQPEVDLKPSDYIIKTKEAEFVKVYAVNNFYSEPKEFCEHGFNGRRWKPGEVDVVVYPTKYGHRRSYKYIGVDIKNARKEE